jgi:hypothetical protein
VKSTWGHSTIAYAVHVAREAGARQLALFHHDPLHSDDDIDRLLSEARSLDDASHLDRVLAASEGLSLEVRPAASGHRVTSPRFASNDRSLRRLLAADRNGTFANAGNTNAGQNANGSNRSSVPGGWSLIEQLEAARESTQRQTAPATHHHASPGA